MGRRADHSRGRRYSQTSSFYLERTYEKAGTFEVACSKWFFLPHAALSLACDIILFCVVCLSKVGENVLPYVTANFISNKVLQTLFCSASTLMFFV